MECKFSMGFALFFVVHCLDSLFVGWLLVIDLNFFALCFAADAWMIRKVDYITSSVPKRAVECDIRDFSGYRIEIFCIEMGGFIRIYRVLIASLAESIVL